MSSEIAVIANLTSLSLEGVLSGVLLILALAFIWYKPQDSTEKAGIPQAPRAISASSSPGGLSKSEFYVGNAWLLMLAFIHWLFAVYILFDAYILAEEEQDAAATYTDRLKPLQFAKTITLLSTMLSSDYLLLCRAWRARQGMFWRALLVQLFAVECLNCGRVLSVLVPSASSKGTGDQLMLETVRWVIVWEVCNRAIISLLIASRIRNVSYAINLQVPGATYSSMESIFLRSSALSSMWTAFFAGFYAIRGNILLGFPIVCSPAINAISSILAGFPTELVENVLDHQGGVNAAYQAPEEKR